VRRRNLPEVRRCESGALAAAAAAGLVWMLAGCGGTAPVADCVVNGRTAGVSFENIDTSSENVSGYTLVVEYASHLKRRVHISVNLDLAQAQHKGALADAPDARFRHRLIACFVPEASIQYTSAVP